MDLQKSLTEIFMKGYELGLKHGKEEACGRPKGKWKQISPANIFKCSVCHGHIMTSDIECYNFCHHCGADMRGEE